MKACHFILTIALVFLSLQTRAADVSVEFELPSMDVAEYHRPYVAVWIENEDRQPHAQLLIWVEQEKWHRDLRSWWRRGGSALELPIDGVSGATRKPGLYHAVKTLNLPVGSYTLNIEAVREVGGREHIKIPLRWQGETWAATEQGESELGRVRFSITP